jgi:STE24 endopeptidase
VPAGNLPTGSISPRIRRRPTIPSPAPASVVGAVRRSGAAARLHLWRRSAGAARLLVSRLDGLTYGVALIFSVPWHFRVVDLPLSLYRQFVIEEKFGFNRMTLENLSRRPAQTGGAGLVIGTPVLLAVLWLMDRWGSWWLYVWLFWCAFNLLFLFIYPTWIAPLFNKFVPLDDASRCKARIEACSNAAASPVRASS